MKKIVIILLFWLLLLNKSESQFNTIGKYPVNHTQISNNKIAGDTAESMPIPSTAFLPANSFALPLKSLYVTSLFGKRMHPVYHQWRQHRGIDLQASYEPVYSIGNGVVAIVTSDKAAGNYIIITHGDGSIESLYAHLSYVLVEQNCEVKAGQVIGISGSTGAVTAPHLHFGIKQNSVYIDPFPVLARLLLQCRQ